MKKEENNLSIIMLNGKKQNKLIFDLVEKEIKKNKKICLICLSQTQKDIMEYLKKNGVETSGIIFVDAISPLVDQPGTEQEKGIITAGPKDLNEMNKRITNVLKKNKCEAMIFDSISTLLVYKEPHEIMKFTNDMIKEKDNTDIDKIFLILKEKSIYHDNINRLIEDLSLMADKTEEV